MGLGLGTMRRVVIEMGALLALSGLLGCAGGQTGEITEPTSFMTFSFRFFHDRPKLCLRNNLVAIQARSL